MGPVPRLGKEIGRYSGALFSSLLFASRIKADLGSREQFAGTTGIMSAWTIFILALCAISAGESARN